MYSSHQVHPVQGQSSAGRSSLYLDLSRLPTLTKNVSETQLVADIRSVGTYHNINSLFL